MDPGAAAAAAPPYPLHHGHRATIDSNQDDGTIRTTRPARIAAPGMERGVLCVLAGEEKGGVRPARTRAAGARRR